MAAPPLSFPKLKLYKKFVHSQKFIPFPSLVNCQTYSQLAEPQLHQKFSTTTQLNENNRKEHPVSSNYSNFLKQHRSKIDLVPNRETHKFSTMMNIVPALPEDFNFQFCFSDSA